MNPYKEWQAECARNRYIGNNSDKYGMDLCWHGGEADE